MPTSDNEQIQMTRKLERVVAIIVLIAIMFFLTIAALFTVLAR